MLITLPQSTFNASITERALSCHGKSGLLRTYIGDHDVYITRPEESVVELHVVSAYDDESPVLLECSSADCEVGHLMRSLSRSSPPWSARCTSPRSTPVCGVPRFPASSPCSRNRILLDACSTTWNRRWCWGATARSASGSNRMFFRKSWSVSRELALMTSRDLARRDIGDASVVGRGRFMLSSWLSS